MPKLNLRDLFWLVLVAAVLCAWATDHRMLDAQNEKIGKDYVREHLEAERLRTEIEMRSLKRQWLSP